MDKFNSCLEGIAKHWASLQDIECAWGLDKPHRAELLEEERRVVELAGDLSDKVVLDLGCGAGRFAEILKCKAYWGMDVWDESINYAKTRCPDCNFVISSLYDPWPVVPDVVLTLNVFRHFVSPMLGYSHIWENLPPGSVWITDFLTHNRKGIVYDGKISSIVSVRLMKEFLLGKIHTPTTVWMHEVGDWRLVRISK